MQTRKFFYLSLPCYGHTACIEFFIKIFVFFTNSNSFYRWKLFNIQNIFCINGFLLNIQNRPMICAYFGIHCKQTYIRLKWRVIVTRLQMFHWNSCEKRMRLNFFCVWIITISNTQPLIGVFLKKLKII